MNLIKSSELFREAKSYFPGGVNSPVRAFRSVGGDPVFMEKGQGAHLWDADGNRYVDYCCSWGPLILGHANAKVLSAVEHTMRNGTSFGAPTGLENKLANLILSNNPFIEKIRFVSSGTEAVMSAIRLARGFTGKNKIIKFEGCYHGHADAMLVKAGSGLVTFGNSSSAGVPASVSAETITVPLDHKGALTEAFAHFAEEIACVIIEPVPANNGLLIQHTEFLDFVRAICTQHKSLLIFDEVISGFRLGFQGAAGYYNIHPDIVTYGKIIGGGFPVGAYGASASLMGSISPEGPVYQAGTLSGNPVAMAAGIAQLSECLKPGFYQALEEKTEYLVKGLRRLGAAYGMKVFSISSMFWLAFTSRENMSAASDIDPESMNPFRKLYHHLLEEGVYLGPSGYEVGFVSEAHSRDDLDATLVAFEMALKKIK
ncbi:MAG TPA: glutamate-1-semialdehyde 2,1-aminomutase [Bacteroidia bacterium]|nr:glutamate-1-semialdehyde 2,1-aminomutase [Bacteroidia bacterium]